MLIAIMLVVVLVILNGVLAASELSIVSARKVRLTQRAEAGSHGARAALVLAENPDRFLSVVQIGITLVGIFAGAFGGATLSEPLADLLDGLPGIGSYSGAISVAIVVAAITYLSLVIGELVPKRLALLNPEGIAERVAQPMTVLSTVVGPAVGLLAHSSDAILRLLGARASSGPPITEEEVSALLHQGADAGIFAEAERVMVENVFRLGDRRADELMTPRFRIIAIDLERSDEENRHRMASAPYTSFPVCEGSLDRVVGVVSVKTLWARQLTGASTDIRAAMDAPQFVPESSPVLTVMERFKRTGVHIALVVDEYGGIEGMLTLNDVLEGVLGDLEPSTATDGGWAVPRADGSWLLDGEAAAHDVRELLEIDELPGEEEGDYETLGGFVMASLQHIPAAGDLVSWAGWRFEVVDMDGNRVDKVLVHREPGHRDDTIDSTTT